MTSSAVPKPRATSIPSAIPDEVRSSLSTTSAAADTRIGTENFPVALRLLPRAARVELVAAYRYARFVDDLGDGDRGAPADIPGRLAALDEVAAQVADLPGRAELAVVDALRPLVARRPDARDSLLALVEANRVDQRVATYEKFDDLVGYCTLSAAPVGRLVLAVAGIESGSAQSASDDVCTALQVLEHCQDVDEDARRSPHARVYLPQQDLRAAGVPAEALLAATTSPALRGVVALQVRRARGLLSAGAGLVAELHGWARLAVAGYIAGGLATATALERGDFGVLETHLAPSSRRTAAEAAVLLARAVRR